MSFRFFVWYCTVGGAWAGFFGWLLGRLLAQTIPTGNDKIFPVILHSSIVALFLGLSVALALSYLDAVFNVTLQQLGTVIVRVFVATLVGIFGGLLGGFIGGAIYHWTQWDSVFLLSWIIVGFLVGTSISFFQVFMSLVSQKDVSGSLNKFIKCVVGGTIGGLLGGIIALVLFKIGDVLFEGRDHNALWSPTGIGFVAIGACIGLLVGLAQVMLTEAWIKVEAGFRPGREMLIQKDKTTIGRAEGSDIGLYGDMEVEKTHANIILDGGRYWIEDLGTPGGTYVNDKKVEGKTPLKAGDVIRVGKSLLVFNERVKRKD